MVRSETLTLVLVNLAGIMERADQSLLPGVYKEVGAALHADPTRLGSLTLFRSIVQTTCYPLAAYLASRHNRAHVIAVGAFLWSAATFLVAFSSTFFQVAVSRGLNGIGLALAIPSIQSLVADSTEDHNRGTAFGWLQVTGNIGSILGYICSVLIAPTTFMGIPGWRVSFHLVGAISVIVGILVACFANDPHFIKNNKRDINITSTKSLWVEFKDVLSQAKSVLKIPTFQVLIAQGVPGAFPGSALSFLAMWLELMGFSHKTTALLLTLSTIGSCFGGIFGGKVGDALSLRMPNAGRIIMSQISASSIIPTSAVLLLVLPRYDSATAVSYGLVLFVLGLLASWTTAATNYPIFAEIVPEKQRTIVYALDQTLENVLASFAPPIVGILAQNVYGYDPTRKAELMSIDRENAWSLARALYAAILTPMIICVSVYSFLYCTYPRDRERARMEALIESEMGVMMKSDDVIFVSKLKEKVVVEGIDDEIECYEKLGLEENNVGVICVDIDLDDSDDERRLLSNHIRN